MSTTMKTPGVYINEIDAFGNSVISLPTGVPAFIGYTSQTSYNGQDLLYKPTKVSSLLEFLTIFGSTPPKVQYKINTQVLSEKSDVLNRKETSSVQDSTKSDYAVKGYSFKIAPTTINYRMYSSLKFFYENGGGDCYVISIGAYDYSKAALTDIGDFLNAIELLEKEHEPTMLVIPDAVEIINPEAKPHSQTYLKDKYANAYTLQNEMIRHCGQMKNRVAILDIPEGYKEQDLDETTCIAQFRGSVEPTDAKYKSYAAAYYPWLHTTVCQWSDVSYENIEKDSLNKVVDLLTAEFKNEETGEVDERFMKLIHAFATPSTMGQQKADLILKNLSRSYAELMRAILGNMNLIAPSAGMAGIYTSVDTNEGVWIAPANVGIQSTIAPSVNIDHIAQEDLNNPSDGKSICAIRAFTGRGNLVWGARTLDGNSNDWRYINVRRTIIFLEQSIKESIKAYVFVPNDANTWTSLKKMIESFLTQLWKQGGLAGPKPTDAFSVSVGLGSTMTAEDILNGLMRISVKVAVSRPAEFIEINLEQEMPKT